MTPATFRAILSACGLTQKAAGEMLGVDIRTVRRWVLGQSIIPPPVAKLMVLVNVGKLHPNDVLAA